jgi:DNA-directed RNA polymerase subunit RPC12/RpoP
MNELSTWTIAPIVVCTKCGERIVLSNAHEYREDDLIECPACMTHLVCTETEPLRRWCWTEKS